MILVELNYSWVNFKKNESATESHKDLIIAAQNAVAIYLPSYLSNNSLGYEYRQRAIDRAYIEMKVLFLKTKHVFPLLVITQPEISFCPCSRIV
jgi:hypothetical protein